MTARPRSWQEVAADQIAQTAPSSAPEAVEMIVSTSTTPEQTELLGLGVMVTVMERMTGTQRRRAIRYLFDRYYGQS